MSFQRLKPLEYLQAEVVCKQNKAMEKATWDDRIAEFKSLDFNNPKTFTNASNPIGLRAAYLALNQATSNLPFGYMISLDASASGLQLLSLLISCLKSWMLCGGTLDRCVDAGDDSATPASVRGEPQRVAECRRPSDASPPRETA